MLISIETWLTHKAMALVGVVEGYPAWIGLREIAEEAFPRYSLSTCDRIGETYGWIDYEHQYGPEATVVAKNQARLSYLAYSKQLEQKEYGDLAEVITLGETDEFRRHTASRRES